MQRILEAPSMGSAVGKLSDFQVANQATWGGVPDAEMSVAAMHIVHTVPSNRSTCTYVNALDPAQQPDSRGWKNGAKSWDKVPQNSWRKF